MNQLQIPYTYLIGWTKLGKFYYGVKFGRNCDPKTFWKNYFTSSKKVHELIKSAGDPDIIQIRKTFSSQKKAILWETKVLKRMKVLTNERWLNANIAGAQIQTSEINQKRSKTMTGNIIRSIEFKERVSQVHKNKVVREETKEKLRKYSGINHSQFGTAASIEKKEKISLKNKGNNKIVHICPHCELSGKGSIMFRHHFDRCKKNEVRI